MKRFILILALVLPSFMLAGDDLATLQGLLKESRMLLDYSFKAIQNKNTYGGTGTITYQDGMFIFTSDAIDVYNDGEQMWSVNKVSKEIVIEEGNRQNLFLNPAGLLSLFGSSAKGAKWKLNQNASGVPVSLTAVLKDGTDITVRFESVKFVQAGAQNDFSYSTSGKDSSWIITDLR